VKIRPRPDFTKPNPGIVKALKLRNLPTAGTAVELGFGLGGNIRYIAKQTQRKYPCLCYETDEHWYRQSLEDGWPEQLNVKVIHGDAFDILTYPGELAIVVAGMIMYNSKSVIYEFLPKLWHRVLPGGILHLQIATDKDGNLDTDFVQFGCERDEKYPNSFVYDSSWGEYDNAGIRGGSFWDPNEINLLCSVCHPHTLVYCEELNFLQQNAYQSILRSFQMVTIQKTQ